jgi:uncharacterized protein DUF2804
LSDPSLPWRGPGEGRPDLPLPPEQLPIRRGGLWRKRWRYAGAFSDELLVCAARVNVGPLGQTFWVIWDRGARRLTERTRVLFPGARGDVWTEAGDGADAGQIPHAPDEGSVVRIESKHPEVGDVRAFLRFGGGRWVESVCPTEDGQYVWTRKRVGVPVESDVRLGSNRLVSKARGVEDESEGYHPRHTVWSWSAGVGTTADGRSVGWNLVSGINDPPERSERAIWIEGEPTEPGPVEFEGLGAIRFDDGARLEFSSESERRREEHRLFVRYSYRQPLGTFSGTLPGGIPLASGLGVMEHHDAHW